MPSATVTSQPGSLLLFRFRGIPVFLHWSWAVVGVIEVGYRSTAYGSVAWNALEYLGLFAIVLLHEFGHALACRSVGGEATHILLWPLGGIAHVRPPQRPAAVLWSIAAGPLVNFVLAPFAFVAWLALPAEAFPDLSNVLLALVAINVALFAFNVLPIYPLDGGQILRALLWFVIGRERSLVVAASLGLVVSIIGGIAAFVGWGSIWLPIIAAYAAWSSWRALRAALTIQRLAAGPRVPGAHCPDCGQSPPLHVYWRCASGHAFHAIETGGACPECDERVDEVRCLFCGEEHPVMAYR